MADKYTLSVDNVSLVAATAKTVVQVATPATTRARLCSVEVGFQGVTSTDVPVLVELLRQTTAGTGTATTPAPLDPAAPASLATGLANHTAEPTAGTVIKRWRLTPAGGVLVIPFYGDEQPVLGVSSWMGLRCTAAANTTVNAQITFLV